MAQTRCLRKRFYCHRKCCLKGLHRPSFGHPSRSTEAKSELRQDYRWPTKLWCLLASVRWRTWSHMDWSGWRPLWRSLNWCLGDSRGLQWRADRSSELQSSMGRSLPELKLKSLRQGWDRAKMPRSRARMHVSHRKCSLIGHQIAYFKCLDSLIAPMCMFVQYCQCP